MKIIGREREIGLLNSMLESERAEFYAVYGRRRIGKTHLVKAFFDKKKCHFMHCTGIQKGGIKDQLGAFYDAISDCFFDGVTLQKEQTWNKAFEFLKGLIDNKVSSRQKIVIFLDELPWLVTPRSKCLQMLEYYWNRYWSFDPRIKLIICGSSASWILKKIINDRGGLHNRVTRQILLRPFNLVETQKYLASLGVKLNMWHTTQVYMATGGVPYYLMTLHQKGLSSSQIIEQLAFSNDAPLQNEFDKLIASLFDDAAAYSELLKILSKHRYGLSQAEILNKSTHFSKGGRVTEKLKALADAGFIIKLKSYQNSAKGVYYRVIDEYTLFYFYWIAPLANTVQSSSFGEGYWQEIQKSAAWQSWSGYAFEAIVYKHLTQVRNALLIPPSAIADSWRYQSKLADESGAQIDILFDRPDDVITLGEIKMTAKPFVIDKQVAANLVQKKDVFTRRIKTQKQIYIAMISASGVAQNHYFDELISGVVTLKDFFT